MNKSLSFIAAIFFSIAAFFSAYASESNPTDVKIDLVPFRYTNGVLEMLLKMDIPEGWKVYSNEPGDTGIPIKIDFIGSTNHKSSKVYWDNSEVMIDKFGVDELRTNVFKHKVHHVIFFEPEDVTLPINIKAKLSFGACEQVCVPASEEFKLQINPGFINEKILSEYDKLFDTKFDEFKSKEKVLAESKVDAVVPYNAKWSVPDPEPIDFYLIILFAIAGGFILNLMPCVLPVLALKLLNIVKYSGLTKKQVTLHLLATSFGIICTFLILAFLTIILKFIGITFGWGVQFQEPWFLIFISLVLVLFASNLWGDFEISLPSWLSDKMSSKKYQGHSINNSIATGAFATLLATPCTAPFLSVSVAFALNESPLMIVFIYVFIGLGMAAPYLLLSITPKALNILPKPGKWMIYLKKFFAFLLICTLVWLLYVLYYQISAFSLAVVVGCLLLIKFAITSNIRSNNLKMFFFIIFLVSLGVLPSVMEKKIKDNNAYQASLWEEFDEPTLYGYVAFDRVVLLDITAEWCLICKGNKFFVLEQPDMIQFLKEKKVLMIRADYTNRSETISAFLKRYNRPGIPFNIVYGPKNKKGILLPEVLTKKAVIDAVNSVKDW